MTRSVVLIIDRKRRGKYGAGQWKDVEGFCDLARSLGTTIDVLECDEPDYAGVIGRCESLRPTDVILYYSFFPELLRLLRKTVPAAKLHVRTVNAEAFQHWQRSSVSLSPTYENLRKIYGAIRLGWRDAQCKRYADALLGISEWDNRKYWRRLPGSAKVVDVPYQCPWPRIRPQVRPMDWASRRKTIVCLAGGRDPIGRAMVHGFNRMADVIGGSGSFDDWSFLLSPGLLRDGEEPVISARVDRLAELNEPWDLLCSARALAVLTPLGFGSKTTIIDALAAGCHVLVHPELARRLPSCIRDACIEYSEHHEQNPDILAQALAAPPVSSAISQLAISAKSELNRALGVQQDGQHG